MAQHFYKIRKAILIPLGIDAVLLLALLVLSLKPGGQTAERAVLALFLLVAALLFVEALWRRVRVGDDGLAVRKPGRSKSFQWAEITHVGCLTVRRKVYLLLTTLRGFVILSGAYEGFPELVREITGRVEADRVEEEARLQADLPAPGLANGVSAWVAAAFLVGILLMKLFVQTT